MPPPKRSAAGADPLLDAAAALARRGAALSVAAVARAAGVSRGAVYKRFAGRDALVAALAASGRAPAVTPPPDARARILDAVGRVIQRSGLAATTLDAVAREAGVGAVTVYRRFTDRKGLLRAFVAERTPRRLADELAFDGSGDRDAGLFQLARETVAFVREHRALVAMMFSADPETQALLAEWRAGPTSVRALTQRFLDAHFPDPSGRTVLAFWGITLSLAWSAAGPVDDDARFIVETFLRGVARPRARP